MDRLTVGMALDVDIDVVLFVQHVGQFSQGFLASFVDCRASRLEQQLIGHGDINLSILFGDGQLVAVESQQCLLNAVQQVLYLTGLLVDHLLQLVDGLFPLIELFHLLGEEGIQLVLLTHVGVEHCLVVANVAAQESGILGEGGDLVDQAVALILATDQSFTQVLGLFFCLDPSVLGLQILFLRNARGTGEQ